MRACFTISRRWCAPGGQARRRRCNGYVSARPLPIGTSCSPPSDLAEFAGNTVVVDADRPKFSRFVRETFGPRAKALGFVPKPNDSDDDQLMRRSLLRVVAPEDPALAAEARRLARAWMRDRKAVDRVSSTSCW
jgi:hypothetical protein